MWRNLARLLQKGKKAFTALKADINSVSDYIDIINNNEQTLLRIKQSGSTNKCYLLHMTGFGANTTPNILYDSLTFRPNSNGVMALASYTYRFRTGYFKDALGMHDGTSWKNALVQIPDSIQLNARWKTKPASISEISGGTYNYTANADHYLANTGGWVGDLKGYGTQTLQFKISKSAGANAYRFGVVDDRTTLSNGAYIETGASGPGYIKFVTADAGTTETTDDIAVDISTAKTLKITIESTQTKLYVDGTLKATHSTTPTPTDVIMYALAESLDGTDIELYELYHWVGVVL